MRVVAAAVVAAMAGGAAFPQAARAGAEAFAASCLVGAADFGGLPRRLAASGYAEVPPDDGPPGPMVAQAAQGRRLWSSRSPGSETFVGLTAVGPGQPAEICWQVTRPDESPARSLAALKRRFPPVDGATEAGAAVFYGGYERWRARVDGAEVTLGVQWATRDRPEVGVGLLYVAKPPARSRPGP